MITTGSQTSQITPNWNKKPLTTILAINCGKTIIWKENSLFWTPLPSVSMFFSAGLQENNFKVGGEGGQQMLGAFFAFLPLIYGKDCLRGLFMCEEKTFSTAFQVWQLGQIFVVFMWCDYDWGLLGTCVMSSYMQAHNRHCLLNKRTMKVVFKQGSGDLLQTKSKIFLYKS